MKATEAKEMARHAQEKVDCSFILNKIKGAACEGRFTHTFSSKDVNALQIKKLQSLGYEVQYRHDSDIKEGIVTVNWA